MASQRDLRRNLIENRAARIVADRLGGRYECHDTGAQQSQYDFDILLADGRSLALEVTEHADRDLFNLYGAMKGPMAIFPASQLKRGWVLWLASTKVRYNELRQEVEATVIPRLSSLEGQGVTWFDDRPLWPDVRDIIGLGVHSGSCTSYDKPGGGEVTILGPGDGGAVGAGLIVNAALLEAEKDDNQKKLERATTSERHLFVWVSKLLPCLAFDDGPPSEIPRLPETLSTLWVGGRKDGVIYVWSVNRERGWDSFTRPDEDPVEPQAAG